MAKAKATDAPTETQIRQLLEKCIDPELGVDIIHLGLVYAVQCRSKTVAVTMTLTTPGCPLGPYFIERIKELIGDPYPALQTTVTITFDPPWSPEKMSTAIRALLGR